MTQDLSALYIAPVTTPAPENQRTEGVSAPLRGVRAVKDIATGEVITVDDRTFNPAWHEEIV